MKEFFEENKELCYILVGTSGTILGYVITKLFIG